MPRRRSWCAGETHGRDFKLRFKGDREFLLIYPVAQEKTTDELFAIARRVSITTAPVLDIEIEEVDCPPDEAVEPGATFRCDVSTASGKNVVATVETVNDAADLEIKSVAGG